MGLGLSSAHFIQHCGSEMQAVKSTTQERHGHWRDAGKSVTRPVNSLSARKPCVSGVRVPYELHVVEKLKGMSKICFATHSKNALLWETKECPRSASQLTHRRDKNIQGRGNEKKLVLRALCAYSSDFL